MVSTPCSSMASHIGWGFAPNACIRLVGLTVLQDVTTAPRQDAHRYVVQDGMQEVVHAVLEAGPWHAAVAAFLEDESPIILRGHGPSATDASGQLIKLITHEVRNALVPVRHHIDALRAGNPDGPTVERIDKTRRGVVRVLEFVDELVATSDLVAEPATSCDVADVLREAISWTDTSERVELATGTPHRVRAARSRLVRAVSNVILNALQATSPSGLVRVSYHAKNETVEIVIDDDGVGVPADLRAKVFDDGYTTRGGRGHGFGLAFVRSVVEGVFRGKVWCEDSSLGGARFVIAIAAETKP
jgi:signal transduction histidine kinase